jgi:hypothetical protein
VGSQQLLLIILGSIVVGIMVTVGISLLTDHSSAQNRDSVSNDLVHAASVAQAYHRRPKVMGGGGGSFVGFDLRTVIADHRNMNGSYSFYGSLTDSLVIIEGIGTQPGYVNTLPVKVSIRVFSSRTEVNEVN